MSSTRRELLDIINVLAKTLTNIDDEQFNKLIKNSAKLVYIEDNIEIKKDVTFDNIEINNLIYKIKEFDTREETEKYIENLKLKKEELIYFARLVNANISKRDNKKKITEKIVDATIGSRLRVEAIGQIDLSRNK